MEVDCYISLQMHYFFHLYLHNMSESRRKPGERGQGRTQHSNTMVVLELNALCESTPDVMVVLAGSSTVVTIRCFRADIGFTGRTWDLPRMTFMSCM